MSHKLEVLATLMAVCTAATLYCFKDPFSLHGLEVAHIVNTAVVLLGWWLWEKYLWKLTRLSHRPNLNGTWKVDLNSDYDGARNPYEAYLVVEQTASKLRVRQFTLESDSDSLAAEIVGDELVFSYRNVPRQNVLGRSPMHDGACRLSIRGCRPVSQLDGAYWTARGTTGTMVSVSYSPKHASGFHNAKGLFDGVPA